MLEEECMVPCSTSATYNLCLVGAQLQSLQVWGNMNRGTATNLPAVLQCLGKRSAHNTGAGLSLQLGETQSLKLAVVANQGRQGCHIRVEMLVVVNCHCSVVDLWLQRVGGVRQVRQHTDRDLWTILQQQHDTVICGAEADTNDRESL